ncbi:hypothetical protein Pcinc_016835 [Petrolisthes cinctipes]|uniref:Uncharacterized protein n=1 Tax=Petrolisthes cinctipes TaxID=88211 RepID=A0AAE1FRY0_PETCI|nr:hypothetical protein Pcinc_016835 [Petrolisthes cinctipes]
MGGKRDRGSLDAPDAQRKARREDDATPPRKNEDTRNSSRREECEVDDPGPPSQLLQMEVDKEADGTRQEDNDGWTVQSRRKKWDRDETKRTHKDKENLL